MTPNWIAVLVAGLVPMVIGFIWYNENVFGKTWMKAANMTEEKVRGGNMPLIFGLAYVLSLFAAMALNFIVIHQASVYSALQGEPGFMEPGSEVTLYIEDFMNKYGDRFRTFKHGALHGTITGLFLATPILGTNALFERKGFRYILVNGGYWVITLAIMGGILCAWK